MNKAPRTLRNTERKWDNRGQIATAFHKPTPGFSDLGPGSNDRDILNTLELSRDGHTPAEIVARLGHRNGVSVNIGLRHLYDDGLITRRHSPGVDWYSITPAGRTALRA